MTLEGYLKARLIVDEKETKKLSDTIVDNGTVMYKEFIERHLDEGLVGVIKDEDFNFCLNNNFKDAFSLNTIIIDLIVNYYAKRGYERVVGGFFDITVKNHNVQRNIVLSVDVAPITVFVTTTAQKI